MGRLSSVATVNEQYRSGYWNRFESIDEMPRYAVLAGLVRRLKPKPSVLDVGCGYGTLAAEIGFDVVRQYIGFDHSAEAIARALASEMPHCGFEVGDFNTWQTDSRFDLIVFNDTAYYAENPTELLRRYIPMLSPDGLMLVAMFRHRNTPIIWRNLSKDFLAVENFELKSSSGEVTDICVLAPMVR